MVQICQSLLSFVSEIGVLIRPFIISLQSDPWFVWGVIINFLTKFLKSLRLSTFMIFTLVLFLSIFVESLNTSAMLSNEWYVLLDDVDKESRSELIVCLNSSNSGKIKPPSEQTLFASASSSSLMYSTASSTTLSWNAKSYCQEYIKNIKTE